MEKVNIQTKSVLNALHNVNELLLFKAFNKGNFDDKSIKEISQSLEVTDIEVKALLPIVLAQKYEISKNFVLEAMTYNDIKSLTVISGYTKDTKTFPVENGILYSDRSCIALRDFLQDYATKFNFDVDQLIDGLLKYKSMNLTKYPMVFKVS